MKTKVDFEFQGGDGWILDLVRGNQQRLRDCIAVLEAGKAGHISDLAAMIAVRAIIDNAISDHKKWRRKKDGGVSDVV